MLFVGIGVDIADGNGFHLLFFQVFHCLTNILFAQRRQNFALVADPLRYLPAQIPGNKGLRLFKHHVKQVRAVAPGQLQNIPEALRGNEGGLRAFSLGQCVDDRGCAMEKRFDALGVHPALCQNVQNTLVKVGWRGMRFFQNQGSGFVDGDQIGKGAADVCCDFHNGFPPDVFSDTYLSTLEGHMFMS